MCHLIKDVTALYDFFVPSYFLYLLALYHLLQVKENCGTTATSLKIHGFFLCLLLSQLQFYSLMSIKTTILGFGGLCSVDKKWNSKLLYQTATCTDTFVQSIQEHKMHDCADCPLHSSVHS